LSDADGDSSVGILFSAKAQHLQPAWGSAPGLLGFKNASAESAIHFWRQFVPLLISRQFA
jgi:hypothetical protein